MSIQLSKQKSPRQMTLTFLGPYNQKNDMEKNALKVLANYQQPQQQASVALQQSKCPCFSKSI